MIHTETLQAETRLLGMMPVIGFGTWQISGRGCIESVKDALNIGYKHIDTAQLYRNEKEVGKGIKASNVDREDIFVTTKIATHNLSPKNVERSTFDSLTRLDMDYVDLLLIHWPTSGMDLHGCLEKMFELKEKGKVKEVGVSNFNPSLFKKSIEYGNVITNQLKFTPHDKQFENLEIAKKHNKIITAYSPLEMGSIVGDKFIAQVGEIYNKSAAQVTLRWLIQLGNVSVIPKASSNKHREENLDIFDFELTDEDMKSIGEGGRRME